MSKAKQVYLALVLGFMISNIATHIAKAEEQEEKGNKEDKKTRTTKRKLD
mgnify:CR=1 FL=1